jgi:hypothetical protein
MTTTRPGPDMPGRFASRPAETASLPAPGDTGRLSAFLPEHPHWSVFWDKRSAVWRAAEDDPDSALYAESQDLDRVISYITAHP